MTHTKTDFTMTDESKQKEKEFYRELVNRFFNENSYFFHCINHELDGVLSETKNVDNEIYLLLGNFFDKLISSENVVSELTKLKQVNEFFEFVDKLEQSVSFLHKNELDTERMKIEIEGLAHSMFNSALLAFQTPNAITYINRYLNGKNAEPEQIKQHEIPGLSSTEPVTVDSGAPDETASLKEGQGNKDETDFHPEANIDTEVRLMGGLNIGRSIEDSSFISEDGANVSSQPGSFIAVFQRELREKINLLEQIAGQKNITAKGWKKSTDIIDSIMMTSVIYGFEAYEQISAKSKKQLKKYIAAGELEAAKSLLCRTVENLICLIDKNDPENVNQVFVKKATQSLLNSKAAQPEPAATENFLKKEIIEEKKSPSKFEAEVTEEHCPLLPQNVMKIKIPGEDDEEIHSLIAEISKEAALKKTASFSKPITLKSPFEAEPVLHIKDPKLERSNTFFIYKQQAELYFNVIDDALITLEKQRRNKTALEDLELASNALYGLSLKLNLDPMEKFPDLILTLIKNIIATNYTITEKDHSLIKKGFHYFKNLGNINEFDGTKFEEIIKAIMIFNEQVKTQASQEADLISFPSSGRVGFA